MEHRAPSVHFPRIRGGFEDRLQRRKRLGLECTERQRITAERLLNLRPGQHQSSNQGRFPNQCRKPQRRGGRLLHDLPAHHLEVRLGLEKALHHRLVLANDRPMKHRCVLGTALIDVGTPGEEQVDHGDPAIDHRGFQEIRLTGSPRTVDGDSP